MSNDATKVYCFDLDLTLCDTNGTNYESSVPYLPRINLVNFLYREGNTIKIYTARGSKSGQDFSALTRSQLSDWGVLYHELYFGKPYADLYVDDKAVNSQDFDWELDEK